MSRRFSAQTFITTLFATIMLGSVFIAHALKPDQMLKNVLSPVSLGHMIPSQFADWTEITEVSSTVINPELTDTLSKTYDQILTRTYINNSHNAVMLSIAYGENQIDEGALHLPEICYPAQGLMISDPPKHKKLATVYGDLQLKQFWASQPGRVESVSYWTMMGNHLVMGALNTKRQQLSYGLRGYIPDGLIFRVSVIDTDSKRAFKLQEDFLLKLINSLSELDRQRLTGLGVN